MFSFVKKMVNSVIPFNPESSNNDLEEEEKEIINSLQTCLINEEIPETVNIYPRTPIEEFYEEKLDVETFKLVHKTGKVTHLCEKCGIIDGVVYFEPKQISPDLYLKPDDEVLYTAYKARENESERVYKVYALKNNCWDGTEDWESVSEKNCPPATKVEVLPGLTRVITGRVTKRRGREVYIESADIWCDLDKMEVSYIPYEGDWVELMVTVSIDKEAVDLAGDILLVKSLKPLLKKSGLGRVTLWYEETKEGAIENSIYFTCISCENGYMPNLGDEVVYDAVESDQETFKWRALKVLLNNIKMQENTSTESYMDTFNESEFSDSFSDKNGIKITPATAILNLELNETKMVEFKVTNIGNAEHSLKFTKFSLNQNSLLSLTKPKLTDSFSLSPDESVTYTFQCTGKYLGLTTETFSFFFNDFVISRRFEINVTGDQEMNKLLPCKFDTVFKVYKKRNVKFEEKTAIVAYGPKPWKEPKFRPKEGKCVFKVPKALWRFAVNDTRSEKYIKAVSNYAPYLKITLNYEHYAERFHMLLYLEEIDVKINFRNYDLEDVILDDEEDFFVLNVPGLVEKRPSLVIGDKVIVTQEWKNSGKIRNVGYIHEIQAKEVFIKFDKKFHETYDGSECNVSFEPSLSGFSKCHESVNKVITVLGKDWLFPTAVNEKPPQIKIEEMELKSQKNEKPSPNPLGTTKIQSDVKTQADCSQSVKNIVWVNKDLNERQKLAVVNVLSGKGRPLPYIIFGPPGTGKTITLVETVIQIYKLLPESRILITTPSNSSADLICERLIEMGKFVPGQLVRLLAIHRVYEDLVPPKLKPYTTYLISKQGHGISSKASAKSKIKGSTCQEFIGKHRITVATCTAIGNLHYHGLERGHFTHILVDEAGQASEPEVLISATFLDINRGQIVLTGDPLQLGPVVFSNAAKKFGFGVSLLERFISMFPYAKDIKGFPKTSGFDPRFITKLNVNYRSVPEILSLPSQMFYNSDLIPTVSQTKGPEAEIIKKFNKQALNRTPPPAFIFHGIIGQNVQEKDSPSWFNPHEIWQVVLYLRKLYSLKLTCDSIGIVTPYAKQVKKLRNLLTELKFPVPKIGSVEEFQGQEREVIILTTVRSSPKLISSDLKHSLGFVASPRRLNVAVTRARALLIIIGNPKLLSKDPYWLNVLKYCVKNNSYIGCGLEKLQDELKDKKKEEEK